MTTIADEPQSKTVYTAGSEPREEGTGGTSRVFDFFHRLCDRSAAWLQRKFVDGLLLRRQAERLYLVLGGHIFFQTLNAAVRFDLFNLLADHPGLTRSGIAERLGIQEQPARILLLGLTASRFIRKRGSRYFNTWLTNELFTRDSRTNIASYVQLEDQVMYRAIPHFFDSLKAYRNLGLEEFQGEGPTIYERLAHSPGLEETFQEAMAALSVQTNEFLSKFLDLSHVNYLIDIGGGDGTNIMALAERFPRLRARVFDLPSACEIAREKIDASAHSDRLGVIPGNCFDDEFPDGADSFLFAHFFTIWSAEKNQMLLKKCYRALPRGGTVIIFNMMQSDDETGPLSAAVGSPYFLTIATGEGMVYTWSEYEQWMREAGFRNVRRIVLPRDHGAIIGSKG